MMALGHPLRSKGRRICLNFPSCWMAALNGPPAALQCQVGLERACQVQLSHFFITRTSSRAMGTESFECFERQPKGNHSTMREPVDRVS